MIEGNFDIRVRYSDTDQMGYVYYGRYANFYEIARVELFRKLGFTYSQLEGESIGMPVIQMENKFIIPAKYDEIIKINIQIKEIPSAKILFYYRLYNKKKNLINTATTLLTFIDLQTKKAVRIPKKLLEIINNNFSEKGNR
ncbi:MAG TPA: acyl-CoA thioesterase [Cytophagales bacterium]|jgi:acyl-CoA thioester hydrolase|nr:acyl-CoA thioesterase [Cytophagales bacterium]